MSRRHGLKTLRRVLSAFVVCAAMAAPARAQLIAPATPLMPQETLKGIEHHISFMISGGFDLDVLGYIVLGAVGAHDGTPLALREAHNWPDIYVAVPKRTQIALGYGVFQHDEIVGRLSRATYLSQPLTDAGNLASPNGSMVLGLDLSPYREKAWEVGWRHYMAMTRRYKQYANILYGVRTIDPIAVTFSTPGVTDPLGTLRLYDRSQVKSFGLEIGFCLEFGHAGVFAETGAHWQRRLKRVDDDLATWSLEGINDTGVRFYMPLQFGLVFRL